MYKTFIEMKNALNAIFLNTFKLLLAYIYVMRLSSRLYQFHDNNSVIYPCIAWIYFGMVITAYCQYFQFLLRWSLKVPCIRIVKVSRIMFLINVLYFLCEIYNTVMTINVLL